MVYMGSATPTVTGCRRPHALGPIGSTFFGFLLLFVTSVSAQTQTFSEA
jgi:hypothetical protein